MLVKLGMVWVDPSKVEFIYPDAENKIYILTEENNAFNKISEATKEEVEIISDEYASIVNAALQTQSFGGDDGQEIKPTT